MRATPFQICLGVNVFLFKTGHRILRSQIWQLNESVRGDNPHRSTSGCGNTLPAALILGDSLLWPASLTPCVSSAPDDALDISAKPLCAVWLGVLWDPADCYLKSTPIIPYGRYLHPRSPPHVQGLIQKRGTERCLSLESSTENFE